MIWGYLKKLEETLQGKGKEHDKMGKTGEEKSTLRVFALRAKTKPKKKLNGNLHIANIVCKKCFLFQVEIKEKCYWKNQIILPLNNLP